MVNGGVTKNYPSQGGLHDVDFCIDQGEVVALIGESGCGKSRRLRLFNRLTATTEGRLFIQGDDVST